MTVQIAPRAVTTRCVTVAAQSAGAPDVVTAPIRRDAGQDSVAVAIFQGQLPESISVLARGYDDPACTRLNEESAPEPAGFVRGQVLGVTLHLDGSSCVSADAGTACPSGICRADQACEDGGTALSGFPYIPSNFDPIAVATGGTGSNISLSCNNAWFNSTDGGMNWCSGQPLPVVSVIGQAGGPDAVVLAMTDLTLSGTLTLVGSRPVILAVYGNATIIGTLSAQSSLGRDAGAGFDSAATCTAGDGGSTVANSIGSGGGGGGFGLDGGNGGNISGAGGVDGGAGGAWGGNGAIVPLRGGCSGGSGGRPNDTSNGGGQGGEGGGAVQLSAAGVLTVSGTVTASGAGGGGGLRDQVGDGSHGGNGGGGGGSGGAVLLEGQDVSVATSARLTANGGGGGEGGDGNGGNNNGNPGADGPTAAATGGAGGTGAVGCAGSGAVGGSATGPAGNGGSVSYAGNGCGAGGGGGAFGRIRVNGHGTCTVTAGVQSPASTFGGTCP